MSRHVASAVRSKTAGGWVLAAGMLLVLAQASGCTGVKSEPPPTETASPREEPRTPPASAPAEPAKPRPAEPPMTAQPKPAEPPASKPSEQPQPQPPAPPQSKPATPPPRPLTPSAPEPDAPPRPAPSAGHPSAAAAIVDLTGLETRLRETSAIGLFTKLKLKNEVDDLLGRFRTFHEGRGGATLTKLRESYDLLVLKVVSLLQDKDAPLARDIFTSREALWNLLADPVKFKTLGSASTPGFEWRKE